LIRLGAADPDGLATQLAILVEGPIAAALVCGDPTVARAAKSAPRVLLTAAGRAPRRGKPDTAGNNGPAASAEICAAQQEW
jgi:hypothetical protein